MTADTIARLKRVLNHNHGESDVYLTITTGEESQRLLLGEKYRVRVDSSLMGDLKATIGVGILG